MMNIRKKIIIGSRTSPLAIRQAEIVMQRLREINPDHIFAIKGIVTSGDRIKILSKNPPKGMFVKEIEEALLKGRIDLAVHSLKDMPVDMTAGLELAAIAKRDKYADVLISRNKKKLSELKIGSCVGTSSPRRKMQLLLIRPDLIITDIKGNLDTRLKKLESGVYDAIVVAAAGMLRMGWGTRITEYLSDDIMLPAPAQGALGIQVRKDDSRIKGLTRRLNSLKTEIEIKAEREFLRAMGGGCRVPIGALAKIKADVLYVEAIVIKDENTFCRTSIKGSKRFPQKTGISLAKKIKTVLKDKA